MNRNIEITLVLAALVIGIAAIIFFPGPTLPHIVGASLHNPVIGGRLVSEYGRKAEGQPFENGIAIIAKGRAEVRAAADGVVAVKNYEQGYARVVVKHDNGFAFATAYDYLVGIEVIAGQRVVAGEVLGYVNDRGDGRPLHMHFRVFDAERRPLDPCREWLYCHADAEMAAQEAEEAGVSFSSMHLDENPAEELEAQALGWSLAK
jgi:murein DD-endopeptidase MepM/ murein hydrolase activator NlpD